MPVQENSDKLAKIIEPLGSSSHLHSTFARIFRDGNWEGAVKHTETPTHANGEIRHAACSDKYQLHAEQLMIHAGCAPPPEKRCKKDREKPWVVLVTGVNGIRKTSSVHQPWFPQLLSEAIVAPSAYL